MFHLLKTITGTAKHHNATAASSSGQARVRGGGEDVPRHSAAAIIEGNNFFRQGKFASALARVDDALAVDPHNPSLLFARGSTLFAWGRYREALTNFERAREVGLSDIDLEIHLGWTYLNLGRRDQAQVHFRRALAIDPSSESACVALANLLESCGTLAAEAGEFARALLKWPDNYDALMLLGACKVHLGDRQGGADAFRRATTLDPSRARGWSNLGVALGWERRYEEGLESLRRAYQADIASGTNESLINLATSLLDEEQRIEALQLLEQNIKRNPDPRVYWLRSIILLELGAWKKAWGQHEFRWMKEPLVSRRKTLTHPVWSGQDIRGKAVLIHAEQGLGDAIQFMRYARCLKDLGARVLFDPFTDFGPFSHDFEDVDEVLQEGDRPIFDFRIPLLSIPRVLGTTPDSVPTHIPYVKVRPERSAQWQARTKASGKLKVGLAWAGNPKHLRDRMRSIPLDAFEKIAGIEGVQLYSLQKGPSVETEIMRSGMNIVDLGSGFEDFCDTAAAISQLDLVISVDTSVAHLAGALGKPVWTLVAKHSDWRWLADGEVTAWYPTMRLFRQTVRDEWDPVVDRVREALFQHVSVGGKETPACQNDRVGLRAQARTFQESGWTADLPKELECEAHETRYGIVQCPSHLVELEESLRHYGEYRQQELDLIVRFVRPGSWLLDAGCGVGTASLFLSEATGSSGHVISYESNVRLYQIAAQNVAANRRGNVTLLNRTLRSTDASEVFTSSVPNESIDELRLERLDWIRLAPTVMPLEVLGGSIQTLWRLRPWIFVSLEHEKPTESIAQFARDHAYQSWRFDLALFSTANYYNRVEDVFGGRRAAGVFLIPEEIECDLDLDGCTLLT